MRLYILRFLLIISLFAEPFFASETFAKTVQTKKKLQLKQNMPPKPNKKLTAVVIDAKSGRVLHSENDRVSRYPASMTKMMTSYLVFEALKSGKLKLHDRLKVSTNAASKSPSKLNLKAGDTIALIDALLGMLTKSANDAATVLGEAVGGSEKRFAELMTQRAKQLGLLKTRFRNASGWHDPEQVSTAYDMAKLSQALIRDFPQYYKYFGTKKFTYKGNTYPNHNKLLGKVYGVDGIKTGYTGSAGFNLSASAKRNQHRIIAVVMGARTPDERNKKMAALLEKGFSLLGNGVKGARTPNTEIPETESIQLAQNQSQTLADEEHTRNDLDSQLSSLLEDHMKSHSASQKQPAAQKTSPQKIDSKSWAIQIGTFGNRSLAQKEGQKIFNTYAKLLKQGTLRVAEVKKPKSKKAVFPTRVINLTSADAKLACQALSGQKKPCVVIQPGRQ